ncbi:MAG: hypothetical protein J3T61_09015 [Candidatus Brocadiales bacterium]|nr:hypothetical protein [Candidatus Bathyanammoxibius sp.]
MALTVTQEYHAAVGDAFLRELEVTFDSSYPTGGELFNGTTTPTDDFFHEVVAILSVNTITPAVPTKTVLWDPTNSKLIVSVEDTTSGKNAEAGGASDQSAVVARVVGLFR